MRTKAVYDEIGEGYATNRSADSRWERQIHDALGPAQTVLNVGAGSGSYEPPQPHVVALEPSTKMIRQRVVGGHPVVRGEAEHLPFPDQTFDAAMAVLTTHHWSDPVRGLSELCRVSRRRVIVTWDPDWFASRFWLIRDYLPDVGAMERKLATLSLVTEVLSQHGSQVSVRPLTVPADCTDGFFGCYWKRPRAYLDAEIRASISGLALLDQDLVSGVFKKLEADLASGAWQRANAELAERSEADLGYRLVISEA